MHYGITVSVLVAVEKKYMMIIIERRVAVIHVGGQSEGKEDSEVSKWKSYAPKLQE
jgi:hypothetical protein